MLSTILIVVCVVTGKTYLSEKSSHEATVQGIFDKDPDYDNLSVDSMTMPYFKAIVFSDLLAKYGLLPKEYDGSFTVKHKDGKPLPAQCDGHPFEYTMRLNDNDEMRFSIDAENANKLVPCNT